MSKLSRREFAKVAAAGSLSLAALGSAMAAEPGKPVAQGFGGGAAPDYSSSPWAPRMGLELYTVRDLLPKDLEGTIKQVAAIGYKQVEPDDYGGLSPKDYRALMDRYGLTAISTHADCAPGPDLEKTLEGFAIMGHKYTWVTAPRPAGAGRGGARRGPVAGAAGRGAAGRGTAGRGRGAGGFQPPAETPDSVKRTVDMYNQVGQVAKKYGIMVIVHNHTAEFQRFPYPNNAQCPYDIILSESDPSVVNMQLDMGWAAVAGQDILAMFQKNPGRFVSWHVKNFMNLQYLFPQPEMTESQRMQVAGNWMCPNGVGGNFGIEYKPMFDAADQAGMKIFCIEQDNAASWGDSVAAARVGYQGLLRELTPGLAGAGRYRQG